MCELMEKYMKESKLEGKIEATIKTAKSFGVTSDFVIIKTLMENCNLSEDEAKQKLAEYNN